MPLELAIQALISPLTLCFALGAFAAFVKSDLKVPEPFFQAVSIYLMLSIGFKGGAALSAVTWAEVARPLLAALLLAALIPLWSYAILRRFARFEVADAAAFAAHYGSVSAVTFLAAITYLEAARIPYEGYASALLAIMEVPAIIVALLLAKQAGHGAQRSLLSVTGSILSGKSVLLLAGGLLIGFVEGVEGLKPVTPLFTDLFQGFLCIFLLELGIQAARQAEEVKKAGVSLILFGIFAPIAHGFFGVFGGYLAGLSLGGAIVLGTLAASASYIVAPAAIRMALPEAKASLYLTASLAITFPFNLLIGLPIYAAIAQWIYG